MLTTLSHPLFKLKWVPPEGCEVSQSFAGAVVRLNYRQVPMPQITKAVSDDEEDNYDELQLRGGTSADEDT